MENGEVTFINVSNPSKFRQKEIQTAIRRHVMRDIGKSRRKQLRTFAVSINMAPPSSPSDIAGIELQRTRNIFDAVACTNIGKSLHPYGYFAAEPDPRARQLIHFMHGDAGSVYRPFRLEWFAMAIADISAFNLCLANGALFYHQMTQGGSYEYSDCEESATYFGRCMSQMAQRLATEDESVSEGVITTVLGFLCHDSSVGKWDRWLIHLGGLERIVQLRGGFSGLSDYAHLFAFWFDITGCAMHDSVPRFSVPTGLPEDSVRRSELSPSLQRVISLLMQQDSDHFSSVCQALEQTALVTDFVNKNAHEAGFWKTGLRATRLLGAAAHCVLSLPRLEAKSEQSSRAHVEVLCEATRLALLILLAGLKQAFSLIADEMTTLQTKFKALLPLTTEASSSCPQLGLWAMITVACLHTGTSRHHCLVALCKVMTRENIGARPAVQIAKSLIWMGPLMTLKTDNLVREIEKMTPARDLDSFII